MGNHLLRRWPFRIKLILLIPVIFMSCHQRQHSNRVLPLPSQYRSIASMITSLKTPSSTHFAREAVILSCLFITFIGSSVHQNLVMRQQSKYKNNLTRPFSSRNVEGGVKVWLRKTIIGHQDISTDPDPRVTPQRDVDKLKRFLDLSTYFRTFVKDFAKISTPL